MCLRRQRCEGAALIESCIVIVLLCLILFGMLQLSIVTAAYDVNIYAASCAARCAAVGYDGNMVDKAVHVAALPTLGPKPGFNVSGEKLIAKAYLLTQQDGGRLNYVPSIYWDSLPESIPVSRGSELVEVTLDQSYPLTFPFVRAFRASDTVELSSGEVLMRNHAALYLEN